MTYNNYLPPDEDKLTTGIYKVSFEIKVESQDGLSVSDITHDLSEGFERGFGEGFINKVAALNIEKVTAKVVSKSVKIGDRIKLVDDVKITADIYHDDGYVFIGSPTEISEKMTTEQVNIQVTAGSTGYVNKINKDGSLEIADLDKPYVNETWTELGIDAVNIDLITVKAEQVEKIDTDEVK
jgi:hypothetical protein